LRALDIGLANPGIGAIVLHMDCPGGTSYGVQELSDKIQSPRTVAFESFLLWQRRGSR
jgi:ClpP class serine protease